MFITRIRAGLRPLKRSWVHRSRRRNYGQLAPYVTQSERIEGWARGDEAIELARVAQHLPGAAVIVEIGSFLGSSAVLLAGARRVAGSGIVHCVDPFDGSGDSHSMPVYSEVTASLSRPLRSQFEANLRIADVREQVVVHEGTAEAIGSTWTLPIDMLFLDGDQSPAGARSAYDTWEPFLKVGGVIAAHNSSDRVYSAEHDGHRRLAVEKIVPPHYGEVRCVGTTTFGRKLSHSRLISEVPRPRLREW